MVFCSTSFFAFGMEDMEDEKILDYDHNDHGYRIKEIAMPVMGKLVHPNLTSEDVFDEQIQIRCKEASEFYPSKVLVIDGLPVGFINYSITPSKEPWYAHIVPFDVDQKESKAWINHLAVAQHEHKKGYATKLMDFTIEDCKHKGVDSIRLIINDEKLQNFYGRFGFEFTTRITSGFGPRFSVEPIIMTKRITPKKDSCAIKMGKKVVCFFIKKK